MLEAEGLKLEDKAAAENAKNIMPPMEDDPVLSRATMLAKLYPIVKKNYDEAEAGHQQQI